MDEKNIQKRLKNVPKFLGTYAVNELNTLSIRNYPCSLIVNLDNRWETGSHWISILLNCDKIYVCDSLGKICSKSLPVALINFLHLFSINRQLYTTPQLQEKSSNTCGYYALFFILFMQNNTFDDFLGSFSHNLALNDVLVHIYCK